MLKGCFGRIAAAMCGIRASHNQSAMLTLHKIQPRLLGLRRLEHMMWQSGFVVFRVSSKDPAGKEAL